VEVEGRCHVLEYLASEERIELVEVKLRSRPLRLRKRPFWAQFHARQVCGFPGSGQRDQYGVETYWNIAMTQNSTFTPGIQLIEHPSFNPKVNFVAIPSIKFRVAF
jgi:carbohydrate-selective porin OprB